MKNKNRICYIYLPFTNAKVMQHNVCYKNRTAEYKSIGFKLILIKHVANTLVNVNSSGLEWWFIVSLYYFSKKKMRLIADLLFYLCVWQAAICSEKKKKSFSSDSRKIWSRAIMSFTWITDNSGYQML